MLQDLDLETDTEKKYGRGLLSLTDKVGYMIMIIMMMMMII